MTLLLHLRVAGGLLFGLAALHLFLPARLDWKEELGRLTLINRQIFLAHVFFIALTLTMMGALSLFFPGLLIAASPLARIVLGGEPCFGRRVSFSSSSTAGVSGKGIRAEGRCTGC